MKDWFVQKLKQENKQKNCCMAENCHEQDWKNQYNANEYTTQSNL